MATVQQMKIGVLAETRQDERRVALVPDVAAKLVKGGFQVVLQAGAGMRVDFLDDAYRQAGVEVEADRRVVLSTSRVVLSVQPVLLQDVAQLRTGVVTISFLEPSTQTALVEALVTHGITAFSLPQR